MFYHRFYARLSTGLPFLCAASMLALPLVLASPVFARAGRGICPAASHRLQPIPSLTFEIQDFNDNDGNDDNADDASALSNSNVPAERIADQVIAAWTDLLQTQVEKDPLSDTSDDKGQSDDDGDGE